MSRAGGEVVEEARASVVNEVINRPAQNEIVGGRPNQLALSGGALIEGYNYGYGPMGFQLCTQCRRSSDTARGTGTATGTAMVTGMDMATDTAMVTDTVTVTVGAPTANVSGIQGTAGVVETSASAGTGAGGLRYAARAQGGLNSRRRP
ncbi:hypothetical protein CSUB01_04882 [Colletotrichum sublineola]|uniref:Uncharacterized protein n=1 Tax=Colletotrichum sublineola TaxID=1173701 RepID=A0A066XR50_COLSU|nr:hypothetical protein CSUB01_04882 [Colletotrichum sublineola]